MLREKGRVCLGRRGGCTRETWRCKIMWGGGGGLLQTFLATFFCYLISSLTVHSYLTSTGFPLRVGQDLRAG